MLSVVESVSGEFASLFPFSFFNKMQSQVLPTLLRSDENVVVAAPTASGKTVLAELAMVRELSKPRKGKILYLAPLRALTNEKEGDWLSLFAPMGFDVYVVSGERELDASKARSAHIIISTPEKWDSSSRKHSTTHTYVNDVSVIIIDEVHLLDSDGRGGALEALITRMKSIKGGEIRIVALSATMPNVDEIARWIGAAKEHTFNFNASYRPVPLKAGVFGYNPGKNKFVDKYIRLYKAVTLIEPHIPNGQALIFVATRSDTHQAASKLVEIFRTKKAAFASDDSQQVAARIKNRPLSDAVRSGIGFHHAGLAKHDRDLVEAAFKAGHIKILVSTSTLAWGVNLPARVVIIRDIANEAIDRNLSSLDLLQMLGRAGRPQYDECGFGWIIAPHERVQDLENVLRAGPPIRSQLHKTLSEHLNAEISLGTIKSREDAKKWFSGTFSYVQNPQSNVLLAEHVTSLVQHGFVIETDGFLQPTDLGKLASKYYLRLGTAIQFTELSASPTEEELLETVAAADEFADVVVRRNELPIIKRAEGNFKGARSKVRAVLDSLIERGEVAEALRSDAWLIRQNALRLLAALEAFIERFKGPEIVLRTRVLMLRLEYGAPEDLCTLLQLDGVGTKQATQLREQGVRTPFDITPLMLSRLTAGARIARSIDQLPKITIEMPLPDSVEFGKSILCYTTVANAGGGTRLCVTVFANGLQMFQESFYLSRGATKLIPVAIYGSQFKQVTYQIRVDHLESISAPLTQEKTVFVTSLPDTIPNIQILASSGPPEKNKSLPSEAQPQPAANREAVHETTAAYQLPDPAQRRDYTVLETNEAKSSEETPVPDGVLPVGRCKQCGGALHRAGNIITCSCGASYKLAVGTELATSTCFCGLPKMKLRLFTTDICIDRQCESIEKVIARQFAASNFVCPQCHGPLTVVRRKGIIVGCAGYYDGCKTAFLLPINAVIVDRCNCGLPKLQLKTKVRCLDTKCRA